MSGFSFAFLQNRTGVAMSIQVQAPMRAGRGIIRAQRSPGEVHTWPESPAVSREGEPDCPWCEKCGLGRERVHQVAVGQLMPEPSGLPTRTQ